MTDLFSSTWMQTFREQWNAELGLADALAKIQFNSVIGYGFTEAPTPNGVITVVNGYVSSAGAYGGEKLNWDLRTDHEYWQRWVKGGLTTMGLSMAYIRKKLQFCVGDYATMIKDPRMAGPFIKSFNVMGRVGDHG